MQPSDVVDVLLAFSSALCSEIMKELQFDSAIPLLCSALNI
jgi:hypothetical protein